MSEGHDLGQGMGSEDGRAAQAAHRSDHSGDPLNALAPLLRVRPVLDLLCRFGGDWAVPHEADRDGWAQFHIVSAGQCWFDRAGDPPLLLRTGDMLLLPRGDAHILRARTSPVGHPARIVTVMRNAIRMATVADRPADTELICGRLHFEAASRSLLLAALPDFVLLRAEDWPEQARAFGLLGLIRDELDADRDGAAAITTDIASALLVLLIRAYLDQGGASRGVIRLLGTPRIGRAALAMLQDPAHDWTLDALADRAAMSRATLVRAFRAAAGVAPLAFLTDLRLSLARQKLIHSNLPLGTIAADVGYQSEGALSRAMLRHFGQRPQDIRRSGQGDTIPARTDKMD